MKGLSKKRKIFLIIMLVLLTATLGFIWINSMIPKAQSAEGSGAVFSALQAFLDAIFGEGVISASTFRKLAHGAEFLLLGVELNAIYMIAKRYSYKKVAELLSLGLVVAVVDESIQILSDRGPLVTDVLIDFGGIVTACALFVIGYAIANAVRSRKAKKKISEEIDKN